MDPRLLDFAWVLACAAVGGLLGAPFGALAGALHRASGKNAGTWWSQRVLHAVTRVNGQGFGPAAAGGIVGAVDGFVFLGGTGTLLGLFALWRGWTDPALLVLAALAAAALTAAAALFGLLAWATVRHGARGVGGLVGGGFAGAAAGFLPFGTPGLFPGIVLGLFAGGLAVWLVRPR